MIPGKKASGMKKEGQLTHGCYPVGQGHRELMLIHRGASEELDEVHLRTVCKEPFLYGLRTNLQEAG